MICADSLQLRQRRMEGGLYAVLSNMHSLADAVSVQCDQDCLEESLIEESLFYSIGTVCSMPEPLFVAIRLTSDVELV
jgi:hypothetical protein